MIWRKDAGPRIRGDDGRKGFDAEVDPSNQRVAAACRPCAVQAFLSPLRGAHPNATGFAGGHLLAESPRSRTPRGRQDELPPKRSAAAGNRQVCRVSHRGPGLSREPERHTPLQSRNLLEFRRRIGGTRWSRHGISSLADMHPEPHAIGPGPSFPSMASPAGMPYPDAGWHCAFGFRISGSLLSPTMFRMRRHPPGSGDGEIVRVVGRSPSGDSTRGVPPGVPVSASAGFVRRRSPASGIDQAMTCRHRSAFDSRADPVGERAR